MAQSYGGRGRGERPRDGAHAAPSAAPRDGAHAAPSAAPRDRAHAAHSAAPRDRAHAAPCAAPRIRIDDDGATRSLVVDETFASFYRPGEISTHCVWDAIAAPILWLPPARRRRILLLGLGGGSVARIARALAPEAEIVGVEFEPEVVRLARAHLDLDEIGVRVELADARRWVEAQAKRPARYDAILEDVFVGSGDDVHKPDWIPDPMHRQAFRMLARGGVFVSNTLDEHARVARAMRARFEALVSVAIEDYDNRVLVGASGGLSGAALRAKVKASRVLESSLDVLSFRSR